MLVTPEQPRERKRRAHHYQNFYGSSARSGFGRASGLDDAGGGGGGGGGGSGGAGISLNRLGFSTDRGGGRGDFSTGYGLGGGGGARIKFGGVSFRTRDLHDHVASSQL